MDMCDLCPRRNDARIRFVPCERSRVSPEVCFGIGEGPGLNENSKGRPFVGKTGKELDRQYLPLAGLERYEVHLDNTVKCLPVWPKGNPSRQLALTCARKHLLPELERVNPEAIVPMGGVAWRALRDLGWAPSGSPEIEYQHGIPIEHAGRLIVPTYHPAAGLHSGDMIQHLREDFIALGKALDGEVVWEPYNPPKDYGILEGQAGLEELKSRGLRYYVALDTEHDEELDIPWGLSVSDDGVWARVVRADQTAILEELNQMLQSRKVILHNAPYDLPVLEELRVVPNAWADTIECAYLLAEDRQSLKVLSYRRLGISMREYEDVVKPYGYPGIIGWLDQIAWGTSVPEDPALAIERKARDVEKRLDKYMREPVTPKRAAVIERNARLLKDLRAQAKLVKAPATPAPQVTQLNRLSKRLFSDLVNQGLEVDPWARIKDWPEELEALARAFGGGRAPRPSISKVPLEAAVDYACQDAANTRLLWDYFMGAVRDARRNVKPLRMRRAA